MKETAKEVLIAVIPVTVIVSILNFVIVKVPAETFINFLFGTLFIVLGFTLFLTGVKLGFVPMGETIGTAIITKGKLSLMIIIGFILGFAVTFAEPDVQVLSMQIDTVSNGAVERLLIVSSISLGVGIFLTFALLRIIFKIKIRYLLLAGYLLIVILSFLTSPDYLAVAFDAGGVTTGPMTVPFILSLGVGVAAVIKGRNNSENSFGLVALSSIGPVIAVLIMGVIMK